MEPFRTPGFPRFWTADAILGVGATVTVVAIDVLVVDVLGATPLEAGTIRAVQFLPYLLVGLLAGALVDRWRKRSVIVWTSAGRALVLAAIPALRIAGALTLPALAVILFAFGVLAVFGMAAHQSILPSLVPREALLAANGRLGQSAAVADTAGNAFGGGLVSVLGAPFAILADAVGYLVGAVLMAGCGSTSGSRAARAAPSSATSARDSGSRTGTARSPRSPSRRTCGSWATAWR